MQILVLTESFPTPHHPGRGIFIREQVHALAAHHSVTVLFPRPFWPGIPSHWLERRARHLGRREPASMRPGCQVKRPGYLYVPRNRTIRSRQLANLVRHELDSADPPYDLVHAHWLSPPGLAAVRAVSGTAVPTLVTAHAGDVYRDLAKPGYLRMAREVVQGATRLIAVADYFRDPLERLGATDEQLRIIPNGVDLTRFHPAERLAARAELDLPIAGPMYLYIGNLEVAKGVMDLVEAFFISAPQEAVLVVAGTGPLWPVLGKCARESGGRLILRGWQPHDTVARYVSASNCFVLPSYGEGNPVTVLESLCCGIPVIGSTIPAFLPLIKPGHNGFLVPPGAVRELASRLLDVLAVEWDPAAIAREAGCSYGWPTVAERIIAIYEEAMAVTGKLKPEHRT